MARDHQGDSKIAQQLIIKAPPRQPLDVGQWRQALAGADKDKIRALYNLYEDILLDGVLSDAISRRIDAITSAPLTFVDADGEEVEAITELMDSEHWEEMLTLIMQTRFWGRAAFELALDEAGGILCKEIPPKHINLKDKSILIKEEDTTGIPYEGRHGLVVLGKQRKFGLLLKAAPYAIYKRGGFGDWAQWVELFGMPQRIGKYNINDPESRKLLEAALSEAGSASYVVAPEGTEITNVETGTGNSTSFNEFRGACNEEMLITILGQTMTTVQGERGARSLGEVHQEVEASKYKSDLRYVRRILNQHIKPILESYGLPVSGGRFAIPEEAAHLEVSELLQLSDIMDIPKSYLHDKFAIPMAAEGEPLARRQQMPALDYLVRDDDGDEVQETSPSPQQGKGDEKKPQKGITNSDEASWLERVMRFFGLAPSVILGAPSATCLPIWTRQEIALADADAIGTRVIKRIAQGKGNNTFDAELFAWLSEDLIKAARRAFKCPTNEHADIPLEATYKAQNDAFVTAMEVNLFRFSAGKTLSEVQALNEAFRKSKSYDDFEKRAYEITGKYNKRWQRTEYETAVLAAESAVNYRELSRKANIFPYWQYKTVGDDAVRREHADLDGLILHYSDPRWDEIYPPNGWKCRCSVRPMMKHEVKGVDLQQMRRRVEEYQKTSDWKNAEAQGWGVNRSKDAVIFDNNQQYIHKLPTHAARAIDDLGAQHYDLPSVNKLMKEQTAVAPMTERSAEAVWDDFSRGDVLVLKDYEDRTIVMGREGFDAHTEGKGEDNRIKHWDAMLETLQAPDEVWVHRERGDEVAKRYQAIRRGEGKRGDEKLIAQDTMTLLRYYQDKIIVANVHISPNGLELRTWYELALKKNVIKRKRRGLLVHRARRKKGQPES